MAHTQKNIKDHVPCNFAYKVVYIDNKLSKKVALYRGKIAVYKFFEVILEEHDYCKKSLKSILIAILLCLKISIK